MGMIARVRFPELASPELALPTLLLQGVPPAIGTLGLAAVFSAEISAADAVLFMLTTSVTRDLYSRFIDTSADERKQLLVARIAAVGLGAAAVVLAMTAESVIAALSIFYTLMGVGLFVPILAGLFIPRASSAGAVASTVCGVLVVDDAGDLGSACGGDRHGRVARGRAAARRRLHAVTNDDRRSRYFFGFAADCVRVSGTKYCRAGIATFGSVALSITAPASMTPLACSRNAVSA
jgi:hypothetical protein